MQAVVLAGGLGTRLRPLTNTVPKPLLPILDRPMIEYILSSLPEEVDTVILAVSYMSDVLRDYFSSRDLQQKVVVVNEVEPLGTGGAIKNVEKYIKGTTLVFNGDIISSIDTKRMIEHHRSKGGIGTIALWQVEDPSRFGVVDIDEDMRIHRFLEKVPKEEAPSNFINAGVYVLEADILDHMEPGVKTSIERQVFPKVIDRGLYGFTFDGFWVDAGTPSSYLMAQELILQDRGSKVLIEDTSDVELVEPVFVSSGCSLGKGSTIGPNTFLGKGVDVGAGCQIIGSILYDGCKVKDGIEVRDSILGKGVVVEGEKRVVREMIGDSEIL